MTSLFCGNFLTLEGFDIYTRWRSPTERRWSSRKATRRKGTLFTMASRIFEPGTVSKIDKHGLKYGGINI